MSILGSTRVDLSQIGDFPIAIAPHRQFVFNTVAVGFTNPSGNLDASPAEVLLFTGEDGAGTQLMPFGTIFGTGLVPGVIVYFTVGNPESVHSQNTLIARVTTPGNFGESLEMILFGELIQ